MEKIFVPVDFSEHTESSVEFALQIALRQQADIHLFHAFFNQIYFTDSGFQNWFESNVMLTDEIVKDFYEQKKTSLEILKKKLQERIHQEQAKIKVESNIVSGDPEYQILEELNQVKPGLVVMGSSGIGRKSFLTGSVARKIMDHAPFPVLAIPEDTMYQNLLNIVYMMEFDPADVENILKIFKLFSNFDIRVFCLHLNIDGKTSDLATIAQQLEHDPKLEPYKQSLKFNIIECKQPMEALSEYLKSESIDLISFIPHKRNVFQSIFRDGLTKHDLFHTNIPILAIH